MRRSFVGVAGVIFVVTVIASTIYYARIYRETDLTFNDFSVFYITAGRMLHRESLYAAFQFPEYLFKYPPPVGMGLMPLATMPSIVAIRWWYALLGAALLGAFGCARGLLRPRLSRPDLSLTAYLLILLTILRPYLANIRLGQIDVVLAGLLLAFLLALSRRRDRLAGWWLGAAILCKLVPAIWLLYLALLRRWRALGWTGLALVVLLLTPLPHLGVEGTLRAMGAWWHTVRAAGGNLEWLVRYKNQSLISSVLRAMTGAELSAVTAGRLAWAWGITGLLAVAYAGWIWQADRRVRRSPAGPGGASTGRSHKPRGGGEASTGRSHKPRGGGEASTGRSQSPLAPATVAGLVPSGLVMIAMVIFSPHAWVATFIHLLWPYAILVAHVTTQARRDWVGWGLLAGSWLLVTGTAPDLFLGLTRSHAAQLLSPLTIGALLLAAGLWRVLLTGAPPAAADTPRGSGLPRPPDQR